MTFSQNDAGRRLIGIDVGGTKVRAIAADEHGVVLAEATEPTAPEIVAQLVRLIRDLGPAHGIGIGVPGAVHPETGVITKVPNVPELEGLTLAAHLEQALGAPVAVENDVLTAALAERGEDAGEPLAVVAAGTGIGLGLVYRGSVLRGAHGAAGEIADLPLPDGRILEDHVSISGLLQAYRTAGGTTAADTNELFDEASAGSPAATQAIDEYAKWLAYGMRTVVATVDPGRIVLTGGLGGAPATRAALRRHLDPAIDAIIVVSEHGGDAPAQGALRLAAAASLSPAL